jgi:hypothetical protein
VKAFSGSDPMRAIADLVAEYWARDDQKTLLNILTGIFAAYIVISHVSFSLRVLTSS